ncbi:unnamed protein product, partial [marine sediment metagenome]
YGPWQTILQYTGSSTGGNISEDISELAADQSNVRIRWHYYDAFYDEYWGIDNVKIIGNFRIPPMQMAMGGGGGSTLKSMGMMMESSFFSLVPSSIMPSAGDSDDLILSVTESINLRPERLAAKSQKFYDITPQAIAELKTVKPKPLTTRELYELRAELFKLFSEIWLSIDMKTPITEEQWLEFRKALEESGF